MIFIRKSKDRGHADHGWLKAKHSFSFADYHDPRFMGFSVLRVINQDIIKGGTGFGTHPHRDMEIVTYIIRGALAHKDSLGSVAAIRPGEVQRMSAGSGIRHSEFNEKQDEETELLQIWLEPDTLGIEPGYEQKDYSEALKTKQGLLLVASNNTEKPNGTDPQPLKIHQDVRLYVGKTDSGTIQLPVTKTRAGWLQLIEGQLEIDGQTADPGDGIAMTEVSDPQIKINKPAHFLFFDLPGDTQEK